MRKIASVLVTLVAILAAGAVHAQTPTPTPGATPTPGPTFTPGPSPTPSPSPVPALAYVTNQSSNTVQVLRTTDGFLMATIPVGTAPTGISIPSVGGFAYVANRGNDTVSRIDLATNTVTATIPVPGDPTSVAVLPDGTKAYVVQSTNCMPPPTPTPGVGPTPLPPPSPTPTPHKICTVAAIDTASNAVVATINVGEDPFAVAASPSNAFVYVTNRAENNMTVIDTATNLPIYTVPVGNTPEGLGVGAGQIYVTNDADNTVTVVREVDLQVTGTVITGAGPLGVGVSWDGTRGIVGNDPDGTASIFDTATNLVLATPIVGANPTGVAWLPDSSAAFIANSSSGTVSKVSGEGGVANFTVFGSPVEVAITPQASLRIAKIANPNPPQAGQIVTFGLTYANVGSGAATNSLITDVVPAHMTFDSATGGGALVAGPPAQIQWTIPAIPVGGSGTITANFLVASPIADMTPTTNIARITDPATGVTNATGLFMKIDSDPVYEISVVSTPDPVPAGATMTYTVSFGNIGTSTSVATRMDVTYDPGVTFISSVPPPAQGDDVWFFDSIPPGGGGAVTITVQVGSPLANGSFLMTDFKLSDAFGNPTTATALTAVQSAPALALTMVDIPDPVPNGGNLLYDIVYSNPGTDTANGVVLTLAYDPNVVFLTSDVLPDAGTTNRWTLSQVPGGGVGRIMVQVQVPQIIPSGTVLSTSGSIVDVVGNTAAAAVDTTVNSTPSLSLSKIDGPDPVPSGGQVTYTLTYSNVGGADATGVVVAESYPTQLAFVSATPPPDAGTDNQWTIGTVAPGTSGIITIVMDAIAPNGSIANNVAIATDSLGANATATASTIIDLLPNLTVGIADTPDPVAPGGLSTYTINYGNSGTEVANNVTLSASLPSQVTIIQATPPPDPGTTSWTLGTLPIGASGTITIQALVESGIPNGTLLFSQASIQDDSGQLASASDSTVVTSFSNLALAVNVNPNPVASGGALTYQIVYGNPSDGPLAGVAAHQAYDPNINFVSSVPPASAASHDIWSLATLSPGEVGSILVNLTVDTGLPAGTVLLSEARIEAVTGEQAQAAEVNVVGGRPALDVEVTSATGTAPAGGAIDFTVTYRNTSASTLNNVVITFDPGAFGLVIQGTPVATDPSIPLWDIGTLAPGANGSIVVKVVNGATAGGILSVSATGTASGGFTDTDTYHVAAVGGGTVSVINARYESRPPAARGPLGQVKLLFGLPDLPLTWDGTQGVGITFSNKTQVLAAVFLPPGTLQEITGRGGVEFWKFTGDNPGPAGGNVFFRLRKKGDLWKLKAIIGKYDVPVSNTSTIRMTVSLGDSGFSAERLFSKQGGAPTSAGSQRLRYAGDH